ncbi:MAG: DotD/TraH family lipoprotein, partial [Acetobacteraceae bacterium]
PAPLERLVSFSWNGPLDQAVAKLAQSIGYTYYATAPKGAKPITVSVNLSSVPAYQVFKALGDQAGTRATVEVDPIHHSVSVIDHG